MKKPIVFAVAFAFLSTVVLYASGGLQTVYAAVAYQCTKCGLIIHSDPHNGGYDPSCPDGGIHAWAAINESETPAATSPSTSENQSAHSYTCSKCGLVLHSDPHDGGYDPSCPKGGIHAWVQTN